MILQHGSSQFSLASVFLDFHTEMRVLTCAEATEKLIFTSCWRNWGQMAEVPISIPKCKLASRPDSLGPTAPLCSAHPSPLSSTFPALQLPWTSLLPALFITGSMLYFPFISIYALIPFNLYFEAFKFWFKSVLVPKLLENFRYVHFGF